MRAAHHLFNPDCLSLSEWGLIGPVRAHGGFPPIKNATNVAPFSIVQSTRLAQ